MSRHEILVHVSAPSTLQDDKNFRNLALLYDSFDRQRVISLNKPGQIEIVETSTSTNADGQLSQRPLGSAHESVPPPTLVTVAHTAVDQATAFQSSHTQDTSTPLIRSMNGESAVTSLASSIFEQGVPQQFSPVDPPSTIPASQAVSLSSHISSSPQFDQENINPNSTPNDPCLVIPPQPPAQSMQSFQAGSRYENYEGDDRLSHATPFLQHLVTLIPLETYYQCARQSRPLHRSERGYWLFDTSGWDSRTTASFWSTLHEMLGDGQAGWGVWVCAAAAAAAADSSDAANALIDDRQEVEGVVAVGTPQPHTQDRPHVHAQAQHEEVNGRGSRSGQGTGAVPICRDTGSGGERECTPGEVPAHASVTTRADGERSAVQAFCWGDIVPHIYCLLYVASQSRIKRCRAVWVDAGDVVVVEM